MSKYTSFLLQLLALLFLNWILLILMPVIVEALMLGMREWDAVGVVFCWGIQVAFLIVSFSLRDYLMTYVKASVKQFHPFMKYSLLLGKAWVLCTGLWLLISKMNGFGFLLLGEMMLLMVQIYCWVGMAAPMGRWRLSSRSSLRRDDPLRLGGEGRRCFTPPPSPHSQSLSVSQVCSNAIPVLQIS